MHTLSQLKSGELLGVKRLQIVDELTEFPNEIFSLADTLETLDLSNNRLDSLPSDFGRLHRLNILFLSNNLFKQIPLVLADCTNLDIIGFKANQITDVPEAAFPLRTRWLILTDNQIEKLPDSMGDLPRLQKLMLAGNKLETLPTTLAKCANLQLMRVSANQLTCLPDWLLEMPKLAWLAFAGNPFSDYPKSKAVNTHSVSMINIKLQDQLGEGASGIIYRAKWINPPESLQSFKEQIAVKIFKGEVTSDGYPVDELQASLSVGNHPNVVQVIAHISETDRLGLVMELISLDFYNLGLPPTFLTCTRDTYKEGFQLSLADIYNIAASIADTLEHIHARGLCHGDLYAHNILVNSNTEVLLSDFGAASNFSALPDNQIDALKIFEVRAYGYLLDDLLIRCSDKTDNLNSFEQFLALKNKCIKSSIKVSLHFAEIKNQLDSIFLFSSSKLA